MLRVTTMSLCLLLAGTPALAEDVKGPLTYRSSGVELNGKRIYWSRISSLTETPPDVAALKAAYARKQAAVPKTAAGQVGLGKWCVKAGLAALAAGAFKQAIALEPDNAHARKALGFVKVKTAWRAGRELLREKMAGLGAKDYDKRVKLADWCRKLSMFAEEYQLLVDVLLPHGRHVGALRRMDRILKRYQPRTRMRPPFAGRWLAWVDKTRHHKKKIWGIYAIDYVKVNERSMPFSGRRASSTSDYFGYGDPVYAVADGRVTYALGTHKDARLGRSGRKANVVMIDHGNGEHSEYAHLRQGSLAVKAGDTVKAGQLIGKVGNSGKSISPHLHFTSLIVARATNGKEVYLSVPYMMGGFTLVKASKRKCEISVKAARPQEGWVMMCPKPVAQVKKD